jgi:hypothetical protein
MARKWVAWRAVSGRVADTCLCLWVSRERLGRGIKCGDFTCLVAGSAHWPYARI